MSFAKNRTPPLAFPHTCFSTQFHALIRRWNPGEGAISAKKRGEKIPRPIIGTEGAFPSKKEGGLEKGWMDRGRISVVWICLHVWAEGEEESGRLSPAEARPPYTQHLQNTKEHTKLDKKKEMCMSPSFICMKMFCFESCAFERDGRRIWGWKTRRGCWRQSPSSLPLSNE